MGPIQWLRGYYPPRKEEQEIPKSERQIVVHYNRYWLPPKQETDDGNDLQNDKRVTVVLEPYVLLLCLLRRVTGIKFLMIPTSDEEFAGGAMPAAYVEDAKCFTGEPLREEQLINYILKNAQGISEDAQKVLRSEFSLYTPQNMAQQSDVTPEAVISYHSSTSILPVYVFKHLRYAVLFIIWVYPKISQNVTKSIILNSTPWPYGYYVYHRRARQMAKACSLRGYSNIEFTIKELGLMLKELQRVLQGPAKSMIHRPGHWTEGAVFANLAVLFSIPCHGVEELLVFHRDFYDLKAYCALMVRNYQVADLQPPFLSGNTFPISYFVKDASSTMKFLSGIYAKISHLWYL
ncbi:uncharacterized protein BBOV_IV003500 [Babesia bovis T2Bo]|uniref:uncharacterized protein n=1 Tax=Babesia bovis T2Bo TaxID=484906 RepID=UPI001DC7502E|nr:uncharacterized protein BBOV_IV003500 [Babesia bovis T2Bo]EDO05946.2 hypothetical protein BBOV_IV003500 [Babesia bovis T2Bo]